MKVSFISPLLATLNWWSPTCIHSQQSFIQSFIHCIHSVHSFWTFIHSVHLFWTFIHSLHSFSAFIHIQLNMSTSDNSTAGGPPLLPRGSAAAATGVASGTRSQAAAAAASAGTSAATGTRGHSTGRGGYVWAFLRFYLITWPFPIFKTLFCIEVPRNELAVTS